MTVSLLIGIIIVLLAMMLFMFWWMRMDHKLIGSLNGLVGAQHTCIESQKKLIDVLKTHNALLKTLRDAYKDETFELQTEVNTLREENIGLQREVGSKGWTVSQDGTREPRAAHFAEELAKALEAKGMPMQALSAAIGAEKSYVQAVISGRIRPSKQRLPALMYESGMNEDLITYFNEHYLPTLKD